MTTAGESAGEARARERILTVLETVADPEIPVLSVLDLGVVRTIQVGPGSAVRIQVCPTYSGCPAGKVIREDIERALTRAGFVPVTVEAVLTPAWTTDWISDAGRAKLERFGIAPPPNGAAAGGARAKAEVRCPHCGSAATMQLSEFGSTPCKALHRCLTCLEPFDRFKCL